MEKKKTTENFAPLFNLLIKPTGSRCNLNCAYCYYLSKEQLYPGGQFRMSEDLMELTIRQLIESQPQAAQVQIAWQGGEPTLMGLEFFRRSVEIAEHYRRPEQEVLHSIQTNGTHIDDDWCDFFRENNFLVGLSLDGPQHMHDAYRLDHAGWGTYKRVVRSWKLMRKHDVQVNILCALHAANVDHPLEVYRYFRDELGVDFIQFIPIVERISQPSEKQLPNSRPEDQVTSLSVKPMQYGRFLVDVFDEWLRTDVGKVFVRIFDVTLGSFLGQRNLCILSPTCGKSLVLEHNGDLYSCDHFVEPAKCLGNIRDKHLEILVTSEKQVKFGLDKLSSLPTVCKSCEVRFACHGGCPRNRFITTPTGEKGLNYLCHDYRLFFNHVRQPMSRMASILISKKFWY
jgi:uncharacterized protein